MSSLYHFVIIGATASTAFAAPPIQKLDRRACLPLAHGSGPVVTPDTAEAFQSFKPFSIAATSATTPAGFTNVYTNLLTTYNEPDQFVHYVGLDSYNVDECAAECKKEARCNAFAIFYERAPILEPGPGCPNPPSTTLIKCTMWAGSITSDIGINSGQLQSEFHAVMAGSNAYVKENSLKKASLKNDTNILRAIEGDWIAEEYEQGAAIEAPLDCHGHDTYMGMTAWDDGQFDAQRCIDACKNSDDYGLQDRKCRFVNTYMERQNNVPVSQHCAMFAEYWPAQYATNRGQDRGPDHLDILNTDSYGIRRADVKHAACYVLGSGVNSAAISPPQHSIVVPSLSVSSSSSVEPSTSESSFSTFSWPTPTPLYQYISETVTSVESTIEVNTTTVTITEAATSSPVEFLHSPTPKFSSETTKSVVTYISGWKTFVPELVPTAKAKASFVSENPWTDKFVRPFVPKPTTTVPIRLTPATLQPQGFRKPPSNFSWGSRNLNVTANKLNKTKEEDTTTSATIAPVLPTFVGSTAAPIANVTGLAPSSFAAPPAIPDFIASVIANNFTSDNSISTSTKEEVTTTTTATTIALVTGVVISSPLPPPTLHSVIASVLSTNLTSNNTNADAATTAMATAISFVTEIPSASSVKVAALQSVIGDLLLPNIPTEIMDKAYEDTVTTTSTLTPTIYGFPAFVSTMVSSSETSSTETSSAEASTIETSTTEVSTQTSTKTITETSSTESSSTETSSTLSLIVISSLQTSVLTAYIPIATSSLSPEAAIPAISIPALNITAPSIIPVPEPAPLPFQSDTVLKLQTKIPAQVNNLNTTNFNATVPKRPNSPIIPFPLHLPILPGKLYSNVINNANNANKANGTLPAPRITAADMALPTTFFTLPLSNPSSAAGAGAGAVINTVPHPMITAAPEARWKKPFGFPTWVPQWRGQTTKKKLMTRSTGYDWRLT